MKTSIALTTEQLIFITNLIGNISPYEVKELLERREPNSLWANKSTGEITDALDIIYPILKRELI